MVPSEGVDPQEPAELRPEELQELESLARRVRRLVFQTVHHAGAGHVGGPLSMAELVVALYFRVLRVDPARPRWEDRDRFVLSKGHAAVGLYATLALRGYFPVEELLSFDKLDSRLQAHPDMTVLDALDMSTGSLGQGFSAAVGMALGARLKGKAFTTWALLGDGEVQEGQVWEAAHVAARYALDNLVAIVDCNGLQQYGWRRPDGSRAAPVTAAEVAARFGAFGWETRELDGHDFREILAACRWAARRRGVPTCLVARTVKGKGVSFAEGDFNWHSKVPTDEELAQAETELAGGAEG